MEKVSEQRERQLGCARSRGGGLRRCCWQECCGTVERVASLWRLLSVHLGYLSGKHAGRSIRVGDAAGWLRGFCREACEVSPRFRCFHFSSSSLVCVTE